MERRDHTVGGVGPRAERRRFSAPPFTTVARVVCERCNSGWMAELEGAAKELLAPMIEAKPITLTPVNQKLVATWAIKTAMMMQQYAHPGGLAIPADHYRQVYERTAPPDFLWIWLASQTSGEVRYWLRPLAVASLSEPTPRRPNGYWVTMSVGALVIQILGATRPLPEHLQQDLPVVSALGLRRIWPSSGDVEWPIVPALSDENVDQVIAAFDHIQPLEWVSDEG